MIMRNLTAAEIERLAMLSEECGDIVAVLHIMSNHHNDFAPLSTDEIDAKIARKYQYSNHQGQ